MDRCKNFFALGMCYWLFNRSLESTNRWLEGKFAKKPLLAEANKLALKAGYAYCDATDAFQTSYEIPAAKLPPGLYRNISGNTAMALGFVAAARQSKLPLFQGSYPITPASDILHELAQFKNFGVSTFQAEDEIAAIASVIGASYAGQLAITTTSGAGDGAEGEALGLAVWSSCRSSSATSSAADPRPGCPTKTEQADLLQALFGRNGEAPIPVLAASTPGDCFWVALEACRIALQVHDCRSSCSPTATWPTAPSPGAFPRRASLRRVSRGTVYAPAIPRASPPTSAIPTRWPGPGRFPGTRDSSTASAASRSTRPSPGNVNYDRSTTSTWCGCAPPRSKPSRLPTCPLPSSLSATETTGDLLVIGWGSTYGAITAAVELAAAKGPARSATSTCAT